ncbi:MAG TPA: response regulator [Steroidobacteraceae bacterium]|nr:response regulator [Steroidobacteraceae bacterium]
MNTPLGRRARIVLVDDDPGLLRLLTIRLRSEGFEVAACETASQALTSVPRFQPDVLVTDLRMKDKDGIALLKELQGRYPALPVILLTAHGTIPDAVTATKSGAFAFLTKPVERDQLLEQIQNALRVSGFASVTEDWRAGIITRNPVMEERLSQGLMAAGSDAPLLITGQPGTGKEKLARAIHQASARRGAAFTTLACANATIEALQTALRGRCAGEEPSSAEAPRGTLYLDEAADLPPEVQMALNGMLDTESTRLISGSNRNLADLVSRGRFREDLYYRLSVSRIDLPPLSQRRDDVPLLTAHFLDELARQSGQRHVLAPDALELLMVHDWPGNVRQLQTLMQHAASLAPGPVISAELVQRALGTGTAPQVSTFDEARDEFMRSYLVQLLQITRGNVTQAAKLAGRNRTDFYKLLARHGLQSEEFKLR